MVESLPKSENASTGLRIRGFLSGLEAGATGGYHIHAGYSCENMYSSLIGGHYYSGIDPWLSTTYSADSLGVAEVSLTMSGFSLHETMPVSGRVLVVHNAAGSRVGCGVIVPSKAQVALLGAYPEYAGSYGVRGLLAFSELGTGVAVKGTLTGLRPNANGGWHVHAGSSCASPSENCGSLQPSACGASCAAILREAAYVED